jgi:hypothetical protein
MYLATLVWPIGENTLLIVAEVDLATHRIGGLAKLIREDRSGIVRSRLLIGLAVRVARLAPEFQLPNASNRAAAQHAK